MARRIWARVAMAVSLLEVAPYGLEAQPRPLPPAPSTLDAPSQVMQPRPALAVDPRIEERLRHAKNLLPVEGVWAVRLEVFDTTGGDIRMVREDYTIQLLIAAMDEMPERLVATVVNSLSERIPVGSVLAELQPTADPQLYLAEWHLPAARIARSELKLEGAAVATAELRDVPRYPLVATVRMLKLRPRLWLQPSGER